MEQERDIYYRQKSIEIQKNIVNYKSSVSSTSDSFIWTYRTTTVDVISIITTTVGIQNGAMKDILLKNPEIKRIKPTGNKNGPKVGESPFDIGRSVDLEAKRKRMNEVLLTERNKFMSKLQISRNIRYSVETKAVIKIQAIYRGHSVRMNNIDIKQSTSINKQIRSNIRSYLSNQFNIDVSLSKFKKNVARIRNKSAVTIQTAYFRYLSRKCLRRKRYEQWLKNRRKAAVVIQSLARGVSARARVKLLIERIRIVLIMKSVLKLQTIVRKHLASRRVRRRRIKLHHYASKLIQDWYRARFARKMAAHIKSMLLFKRTNNGAKVMQKLIRKFLARRRMNRIRLRRVYKLIFRYVTVIQCLIRKYLARVIVPRKRIQMNTIKQRKKMFDAQKEAREQNEKELIENKALLDSVDLFAQARLGLTAEVEDIYTGLVSTDEHTPDEIDEVTGENLLSIAAQLGNLDLIRKCLKWGFNMNFRNRSGYSIFMIAAKYNHLSVMKYLLAPPISDNNDGIDIIPLETPFSEEDLGFLIVAATANVVLQDELSMLKFVLSLEGANINLKNVVTGMAGIHAACEVGHVDAFKFFVNEKADLDLEDDQGQTILHKASCSNIKITEIILGLDPNFSTYMSEQARVSSILKVDGDGKDTILYAALNGQTEILELLTNIVKKSSFTRSNSNKGDISWSSSDISKAILLVEKGNLICLEKLAEIGFDFCWSEESTGRTLAITACQMGDLNTIDLILSHRADFNAVDMQGRNALHYAAMCTKEQVIIPHLMTHANATLCNISDKCLIVQDNNGENVYHLSARANIILNIDLLAQRVLDEALETKNNLGMTPLLVACSMSHHELIKSLLLLGADAKQLDHQNHGCMWHLYHPQISFSNSNRVVCSEYIVQQVSYHAEKIKPMLSKNNNSSSLKDMKMTQELTTTVAVVNGISTMILSRKEKDDEVIRVKNDITLIIALLRAGCTFYENIETDVKNIQENLIYSTEEIPTLESQKNYEAGDIAVQEFSFTMFKTIISSGYLNRNDAWRILISAIWFDDGTSRTINSLVKDGILDIILSDDCTHSSLAGSSLASGSINISSNEILLATAINPFSKIQNSFYFDLTALGWAIKLKKLSVIKNIIRKPYNLSLPVDTLGNPTLHLIAMHGTAEMIQVVIETNKKLRIEQTNLQGHTAGMVAVKFKNNLVAKKLFSYHADVRRWLEITYAGWVLAFVRRKEKYECNTQTGRYGDDDETYFNIKPDPVFITWYI